MSADSLDPAQWRQIEELYCAAYDRTAADRPALLATARPDIRRVVELLLAQESAEGPLNGIADDLLRGDTRTDLERAGGTAVALAPGTSLGRFTITGIVGAGGMGAVYRASDSRLNRDVAIKVLAPHLTSDEGARRRLAREAHTIASLSHPNIVALYDVGEDGETQYLVTELLHGHTMRELMSAGALPEHTVIDLGIQVARGLAAAHDRHIVHRDLKAENIFLTSDGVVKILDFGIARPIRVDDRQGTNPTSSGALLGTPGYMAPEQLTGDEVDGRADLFSLGVALYEAATGEPPFARATRSESIRAVLFHDPPEPDPARVSPALARTIMRCLAKPVAERFQNAHDLAYALQLVAGAPPAVGAPVERSAQRHRAVSRRSMLTAGLAVVVTGVGYAVERIRSQPRPVSVHQFTFRQGHIGDARFAADGHTIVYSASWDGEPYRIYSTRLGSRESRPLDVGPADLLAFSRDGTLALSTERPAIHGFEPLGTLAIVPFAGGKPRSVDANVTAADWGPDGRTMAIVHQEGTRARLEFPAGTIVHESNVVLSPRISPDGRRVCFFSIWGTLMIAEPGGPARLLSDGLGRGGDCVWAPDGNEIWVSSSEAEPGAGGTQMSLEALDLTGRRRVVHRFPAYVRLRDLAADGRVLVSSGSLRYSVHGSRGREHFERDLTLHNATRVGHFAADGRSVLLWDNHERVDKLGGAVLALRALDEADAVQLGFSEAPLALSSGGDWVAIGTSAHSPRYVFDSLTLMPTGTGTPRTVDLPIQFERRVADPTGRSSWSDRTCDVSVGDRRLLIPHGWEPGRPPRAFVHDFQQGWTKPITPEGITGPAVLSPDGSAVAALEGGALVVYSVDADGRRELPGAESGLPARWSADGRSILLVERDGATARVVRRTIDSGRRELVRDVRLSDPAGVTQFDLWVSRDGDAYAYTLGRRTDNLFLIEGLR
ncbi:MAG TPA: protein kinase [Vicinamibacterales bacterium]|nr:protein kinase [Vicinamibacterales bacterium]